MRTRCSRACCRQGIESCPDFPWRHRRRSSKEPSGQADSISASHLISMFSGTTAPEWPARSAAGGVGRGSGGGNAARDDSSGVDGVSAINAPEAGTLGRFGTGIGCARLIESWPSCGNSRITVPHTPPRIKHVKTPTNTTAAIRGSRTGESFTAIPKKLSEKDTSRPVKNRERSRILHGAPRNAARQSQRWVNCPEFQQYDSRSGYSPQPTGDSSPFRRAIRSADPP